MPTVIIASTNPVKINAAQQAFTAMFPRTSFAFEGVAANSGVSAQPMSSAETQQGAENRVAHACTLRPNADYWIAFEGGVEDREDDRLGSIVWVVALNRSGNKSAERAASFTLPPAVANLVRAGKELGEADDIVFGRSNSKQTNGAVGLLTGDIIDRTGFYANAAILALIPFRNPKLYPAASAP